LLACGWRSSGRRSPVFCITAILCVNLCLQLIDDRLTLFCGSGAGAEDKKSSNEIQEFLSVCLLVYQCRLVVQQFLIVGE
jgi:hypothetical protein